VDRAYSEYNLHFRADNKMQDFEFYVNQEILEIEDDEKNGVVGDLEPFTSGKKTILEKDFILNNYHHGSICFQRRTFT